MLKQINNIKEISLFLENDEHNCLIVNNFSEDVNIFYNFVIEYFCKQNGIIINRLNQSKNYKDYSMNLFDHKNVEIIKIGTEKELKEILNSNKKRIIFLEYKLFKNYMSKKSSINTYNFENDIIYFLNEICKITDENILNLIIKYPFYIYSETTKYHVNKPNSFINYDKKNDINFILKIRKELFLTKKNFDKDIITTYNLIKKEAKYKKLSFLTF